MLKSQEYPDRRVEVGVFVNLFGETRGRIERIRSTTSGIVNESRTTGPLLGSPRRQHSKAQASPLPSDLTHHLPYSHRRKLSPIGLTLTPLLAIVIVPLVDSFVLRRFTSVATGHREQHHHNHQNHPRSSEGIHGDPCHCIDNGLIKPTHPLFHSTNWPYFHHHVQPFRADRE